MDRWTGALNVSLDSAAKAGSGFRVAASLLLSPSSQSLGVPSVNAIFFNGDRAEGTGNPTIERLSDPTNIAQLLVSKLGAGGRHVNAWVVDAATFNGPFAVYKELVPSVNQYGEPRCYDPEGFPASSSIVAILTKSVDQVKNVISGKRTESTAMNVHYSLSSLPTPHPKTVILGFSKGGTVVNQILTEIAHLKPKSDGNLIYNEKYSHETSEIPNHICPISKEGLLCSISEIHYVDVGLNRAGAYLTDRSTIMKITEFLSCSNSTIRFALHGTPRQWCDNNRPWIRSEKDMLLQILVDEARRHQGNVQVIERFYLASMPPSLQMHFEIIQKLDVS